MDSNSILPAPISASDLAAAAEQRLLQQPGPSPSDLQFSGPDHELRQKFRRMIDPGILRPNPKGQALASMKVATLSTDFHRPHFHIVLLNSDSATDLRQPNKRERRAQVPKVQANEPPHKAQPKCDSGLVDPSVSDVIYLPVDPKCEPGLV
jgi:hypothetical protein